ncbi:MAG: MBL fold metallo-hydrolase [Halobacteriovoraceae bacterium]|jgi:glyoxylase-like metal-dependent hydrolase (beta-lactamase superfamily II)|nr:MBL fold metallo-hydrolase [Halobacteriovoraceae bacterium]
MKIEAQFDPRSYTLTYIVFDENTKDALVIDPVLDYDYLASKISYESVDKIDQFVQENSLNLIYTLETHAHADHLSASQILKERYPNIKIGIGKHITKVQEIFKPVFNLQDLKTNGSQFDLLLDEENHIKLGSIEIKTIFTPGHTPACCSFLMEDHIFVGDTLFMPDYGTGRCDFPAGSAKDMYHSIHEKLFSLPDETKIYVGHDYQPGGRELQYQTTIGISKKENISLTQKMSQEQYVNARTTRDNTLREPKLILQSVQVNIDAGKLPRPEENQTSYLKIPITH